MHPPHEMNTCKACHNSFTGKYCNICGEKVVSEHDKSMAHIAEEVFHFISHLDGTLLTTVKTIFTTPGKLSADYCYGIRKKYFKPVSFFLLLVVLYLLFPILKGLNMPLESHLGQKKTYGYYAQSVVQHKLAAEHIDMHELEEKFNEHSAHISKPLIILVVPLCALPLWMGSYKRRRYFYDHFIFSAELNSFLLLGAFLILPLILRLLLFIPGLSFLDSETVLRVITACIGITYAVFAFRRFYSMGWATSLIKAVLFTAIQYAVVFIVYRFIQFNVVMWMV